ncbi:hypothetical protein KKG58_04880, partial [Patescibacteria group bacterium]|nr:hypothetical protein [Patescibacteria group bacterium]
GHPDVCKACYKSNEIFITPQLTIKPCHIHSCQFELKEFIIDQNKHKLFKTIIKSRKFLKKKPGLGKVTWFDN